MSYTGSTLFQADEGCALQFSAVFQKGQTILSFGDHTGRSGILDKGEAHISCLDKEGNETILEILREGDTFSEYCMAPSGEEEYSVIADDLCEVTFVNMAKAMAGCSNVCGNHIELMKNLLLMTSRSAKSLSMHVNVLSQRSLREKILTYLKYQELSFGESESFEIPMSLVALANYLSVDRSAMMREIKKMNQDGLIISDGRKFMIRHEQL